MKGRESERGSTLVEYIIGATILFVMLIVGAVVLAKFNVTTAAYAEVNELDETRAVVSDLVKNDFDGAGRNLTRPEPPLAGTIQPTFRQHADFDTSTPGQLRRIAASGWSSTNLNFAFAVGAANLGKFDFTPPPNQSAVTLWSPAGGGQFTIIIGGGNPAVGVWVGIYENGVEVANTSPIGNIPPHLGGDRYGLYIERGSSGPVIKLYRTRGTSTITYWSSPMTVPPYPLTISASVWGQNTSMTNVTMDGAPIVRLYDPAVQTAPLPIDRGQRLTGPVTSNGNTVTILSGDPDTDVVYASQTFLGVSGSMIPVAPPRRGSFNTGDYAMAIDYQSNRAALYRVRVIDAASGSLNLTWVPQAQPAWGRMWADPSDIVPVWPVGTLIVKLAPPVTYAVSADNRLVRMEGNRTATAAFGVRGFNVTEQSTTSSRSFTVTATLAAEGFQTDQAAGNEPRSTVEYTSAPPALNLFNNQLNSTR